jgi:hypothetical protein
MKQAALDLRLQRVDVLPKFIPMFLPIVIILLPRLKAMKFLLDDLVVIVKPLDVAAPPGILKERLCGLQLLLDQVKEFDEKSR